MSRIGTKNFLKQVNNPYPTESQSYTAWKKGFIEGFDSSEATMSCFSEEDLLDFHEWVINSQEAINYWKSFQRTGSTGNNRELLNLWKQSKSN